ncbi:hypothetical protein DL96DRAFT_1596115 [Flagelloscypha sp. PMI_526]|nr:hypothetical protein DL96DRAFT_1596115 [Flagelloscypha sp. PMI_526]
MEALHTLPLDILRLLFEFSASTGHESARALSLVSKEVQCWTDPYLFRTLHGNNLYYSETSRTSLFDQICTPDASPRFVLARKYIRAVAWKDYVHKSKVTQALDYFPYMSQLCLWGNIFPFQPRDSEDQSFQITQGYPFLRRVSACMYELGTLPSNSFDTPFWMTITHLQLRLGGLISSPQSAFQLPLFVNMRSLTHLALLSATSEKEPDVELAFSRLKLAFAPSLVLCLVALMTPVRVNRKVWLAEMVSTSFNADERFVMWSFASSDTPDEMVVTIQGSEYTFWEMGQAVLKRRRKRLQVGTV